jgi:type IV secretion system protein VirB10
MSTVEQDVSLAIRAKPRPVKRFNKRVLIGASSVAALLILGAAAMALRTPDRAQEARTELYNTRHKPMPDAFASLPESYGDMPSRLGPPLPGDLGAAMIGAPRIEDAPENPFRYQPARAASTGPASRGPSAADDARTSDLFFINNSAQGGRVLVASDGGAPTRLDQLASVISPGVEGRTISTGFADALDPNFQQRKEGFLGAEVDDGIYNPHRLQAPISPYQVMAGTIIPASLVTGLNSDLPGQVIAQVTENVYDTPTGAHLLIPQGSRLIGRYDSVIAYGQSRALVVWSRIIMPDGSSIVIDNLPGVDMAGYAGLEDRIDYHTWRLFQAAILSSVLSVSAELGRDSNDDEILEALRDGGQRTINQAGQQIITKQLNVQPTITVRPGYRLRVIVNKDIVLKPYGD